MQRSRVVCSIGLFICLFLVSPSRGESQVLYGTLTGNVTDPAGAPLASAQVIATNLETSQAWSATTDAKGLYTLTSISPGNYDLTVTAAGFQTFAAKRVAVAANNTQRVNAAMQIGQISQSVEVSGETAVLQTDTAEVKTEFQAKQLENLPVNVNGNYQSVLVTVPGAAPPQDSNSLSGNPSRGLTINMNGTTGASTNTRVDGTTAQNVWLPHVAGYVPTLEAIQTVNVVAGSFDAEQGFAGGAAINVQIKSGSNQFHGSLFENHMDNHLKARPYFLPANQGIPKRIINQFGGSVGGPILRDKLFFFASYEGRPDRENGTQITSVPTARMRTGDMSESATPIYDPLTGNPDGTGRTPFANNQIPAGRLDPIVQKLVALTPLPNYASGSLNNYFASGPLAYNRNTLDTKFNYYVSPKLSFIARVSYLHWNFTQAPIFGDLGGTGVDSRGTYPDAVGDTANMTFSGVWSPTPNTTIDAYFGYNLKNDQEENYRLDEKLGTDFLGIPGTNGNDRVSGGWPGFFVSSYPALGNPFANTPGYWHIPSTQWSANVSQVHSQHNFRYGGEIVSGTFSTLGPLANPPAGSFTFNPGVTQVPGTSGNQFNSYSAFLLGLPSSVGKDLITTPSIVTSRAFSLYARDRWQATKNLTLSYGVRWDYYPDPTRPNGRGVERYNFSNNDYQICGYGSVSQDCGMSTSAHNFEPRLGLAWRLSDTFVMRAGYGISYDPVNLARVSHQNYPEITSYAAVAPNTYQPVSTLAAGIPSLTPPDLGNGTIQLPKNVGVKLVDPDFKRSYIQSWNFVLEKQLFGSWVANTGYIGTRTIRQGFLWQANYAPIGGGTTGEVLNRAFGRTAGTQLFTDIGNAHYDGWQSALERRFTGGYNLKFTYTWSKSIGYCCGTTGLDGLNINIPDSFALNRSVLPFDHTHNFTASGFAELPFGAGKRWATSGVASKLFGGWKFGGIFTAYTGAPFTVSASGTSLNAPNNTQQADQVKSHVETIGSPSSWFDPTAFAPVTTARFGTAGFDLLRGPGLINLDSSITRDFLVRERFTISVRADMLNTSNTPHFANPGANVSNLQALSNGQTQLNGFTQITSVANTGKDGIDERFIRLSIHIAF